MAAFQELRAFYDQYIAPPKRQWKEGDGADDKPFTEYHDPTPAVTPEEKMELLEAQRQGLGNRFSIGLDYGAGCLAYASLTGMYVLAQGKPKTYFAMWMVGSNFFINGEMRRQEGTTYSNQIQELGTAMLWGFASYERLKIHKQLRMVGFSTITGVLLSGFFCMKLTLGDLGDF